MNQVGSAKEGLKAPLAVKNGITPSRVWLPKGNWATMGAFLIERFEHVAVTDLQLRLARGDIVNGDGVAVAFDSPYQADQWLWYYRHVENEVPVPFEMPILYADDHLIAVDKPHFLASTPGGRYLQQTALTRVRRHFDDAEITPLHRLDRETAGVLLFCRQPALRGAYQSLFQSQAVDKRYEAIAHTQPDLHFPLHYRSRIVAPKGQFLMLEQDGEPNSETHIQALKHWHDPVYGDLTHYALAPTTGRKHQLRVHMHALGMPILHDSYYPAGQSPLAEDDFSQPLQLLARFIGFTDPVTQQYREFYSQQQLALAPRDCSAQQNIT